MEESNEVTKPPEETATSNETENAPENKSQPEEDNQNGGEVDEAKGNDDAGAKGETENENERQEGGSSALPQDEVSDRPATIQSGSENVQKNEQDDVGKETEAEGSTEALTSKEPNADVQTMDANAQTDGRETPAKESDAIGNKDGSANELGEAQSAVESEPLLIAPPASKTEQQSADGASPTKSLQESTVTGLQTKENHQAEVKFVIMPEGHVMSMNCSLHQSVLELRAHFSTELQQPPEMILMLFDDKLIDDNSTLLDLGIQPEQAVQIEIQSANPLTAPLMCNVSPPKPTLPAKITVKVETDAGSSEIVVHIVQETRKKPFLGGFRHRISGVEFHNASAQTLAKVRLPSPVEKFNRDTQTYKMRNRLQQTTNTTSTQMTKDGCYVANLTDKILIPGAYETAEQRHKKMLTKVILLQTYWRRWLAQQYVNGLRADRLRRQEWERQEELRKQREKAERIKREWERRINPKTKEDFDLLYSHLDKWRKEEVARIEELYSGPERKAALVGLLEQEAYLIASINRHKLVADKENKDKRVKGFLDKAAAPKRWKAYDGKVTEMDTPYTIRAQELRDIYNTLSMKYLTQDERLDVLLTLKHTVREHDCKLTQEIIELIDREADLLMRGVKESNLEGLRKRILTLFLQYCKTPLFNPEAARLIKVPEDPSVLRKNIYFCPSCNSYLPSTEFKLASNSRVVGRCRRCLKLDNDARLRQDFTKYRAMLRDLRRAEESVGDGSRIAFLLQEPDLRYLVENIWNSQSALSAHDDLFDLVLSRWNKHEEWSPWNCVLLTKEEANAHAKLENVNEAYGRMFIGKILHKHVLARNYFSRLPGMADHMKAKIAGLTNTGPKIGLKA